MKDQNTKPAMVGIPPSQFDDKQIREAMERAYREAVATYGPRTTQSQIERIFLRTLLKNNDWT